MIRTFFLTAATVVAAGAAVAAPVTIDSFASTSTQFVGAPTISLTPENPATSSLMTGDAIGGTRTITAERTLPTGTDNANGQQVQSLVTSGTASVSLGAVTEGFVTFQWNAGGADLVDGTNDKIDINVLGADLAGVTYTLSLDGVSVTRTAAGAGTLTYNFSEFMGVNLASVGAISLLIEGPTSFDTAFDFIGATTSAVPIPAAGLLALGGLGALGAVRARRKS